MICDVFEEMVATRCSGELGKMKLNVRSSGSHNNERPERDAFEILKVRLQEAFAAPDSEHEPFSADDIRRRAVADASRPLRENASDP